MFGRVVGGLRPPPPPNEPASGPSAPPWPWRGGPSFCFFFFSPVALASAIIGERRLGGRFREPISRDPQKVETSAKSHFKDNRLNCGLGGFLSPRKAFETVL